MRRLLGPFLLAFAATLAVGGVALALDNGAINGFDVNGGGWVGSDNPPPGDTGTYSYDNTWQDFSLAEWAEPKHDWIRSRFMRWGAAAEAKLNRETNTHFLTAEFRIHDQFFYNYAWGWNSNLPWTSPAAPEDALFELRQGYSEVDLEMKNQALIVLNFNYMFDTQWDMEKPPEPGKPKFYTELEYSPKAQPWIVNWDVTGFFQKKVQQQ